MVTEKVCVLMKQIPVESVPEYPWKPSPLRLFFHMSYRTQEKVKYITEDGRTINWSTTWTDDEAAEITFKSNLDMLNNKKDIVYDHLCYKLRSLGIESRHHNILFWNIMEHVRYIVNTTPNIHNQKVLPLVVNIVSCKTFLYPERELMLEDSRLEFERQNYGMVPATKEAIEMIVNSERMVTEKEDCGICLEEIMEIGAGMPYCDHVFHKNCIEKWLNISHLCPLCRSELPVQTPTFV